MQSLICIPNTPYTALTVYNEGHKNRMLAQLVNYGRVLGATVVKPSHDELNPMLTQLQHVFPVHAN